MTPCPRRCIVGRFRSAIVATAAKELPSQVLTIFPRCDVDVSMRANGRGLCPLQEIFPSTRSVLLVSAYCLFLPTLCLWDILDSWLKLKNDHSPTQHIFQRLWYIEECLRHVLCAAGCAAEQYSRLAPLI